MKSVETRKVMLALADKIEKRADPRTCHPKVYEEIIEIAKEIRDSARK